MRALSLKAVLLIVAGAFGAYAVLLASSQHVKKGRAIPDLKDGDIVFQYSGSAQCPAIAQATRSPYTHCGIVFIEEGKPMVWEAVGPVQRVPLSEWIDHGVNDHYVAKRLKDTAPLTSDHLAGMKAEGEQEMGRPYDIYFSLDEENIYCSELVWKIYKRGADLEVGLLERFGDMDFSGAEAKRVLHDRFGNAFPADQQVITPASLFRSALLFTVDSVGAPPPIP